MVDGARPCNSAGGYERVSLPLRENQLSGERLAGGARGQANVSGGPDRAHVSVGSNQTPGTNWSPTSMRGGVEIADTLVMTSTTVSKSSSSQ